MCSHLCFSKLGLLNSLSTDIEQKMKEESKKQKNTVRILISGTGNSGKSTIIKQMRKIYNKYDPDDAHSMKQYIQDSCIQYMKILCVQSLVLYEKHTENTKVTATLEAIRTDFLSLQEPITLTHDVVKYIKMLWTDNGIQNTLNFRKYYQIDDNASYFLDKIDEISSDEYIPTFEDYIKIRYPSTGFVRYPQLKNIGIFREHQLEFIDTGGRRSERRKWQRFITNSEDIHGMIYVVGISEYDMKLYEDDKTNRLQESIDLFTDIMMKANYFQNKPVLLFFNKFDLFEEKIKKTPITEAFDDFPEDEMDPYSPDDVIQFVAAKFLSVFKDNNISLKKPLHILRTTALETSRIDKVFGDITAELVHENQPKKEEIKA